MNFAGMKIIVNRYAVNEVPNRKHASRRNNGKKAYHKRVQKKWQKRFGTHSEPGCWVLGNDTVAMHPTLYEKLKKLANRFTEPNRLYADLPFEPVEVKETRTPTSFRTEILFGMPKISFRDPFSIVSIKM
jgi:hypothetical protein